MNQENSHISHLWLALVHLCVTKLVLQKNSNGAMNDSQDGVACGSGYPWVQTTKGYTVYTITISNNENN